MIVQCSWKASDDKPITDAVVWSKEVESSADIVDEVMAENCILLEAPNGGEGSYPTVPACQLLLSCQLPNQMSHVTIICEARIMEVYGHHGEYLKTVHNELLEATDDMVVFRGDIDLEKPLTLCSVKFLCLRSQTEMWLYGAKVTVFAGAASPQSPTTIPLAAVEQRLAEMGMVLSDKAEAFKQLVERCQNSQMLGQQDIGQMIAMLQFSDLLRQRSPSAERPGMAVKDSQNNVAAEQLKSDINENRPAQSSHMSTSPLVFERESDGTQTDEDYTSLEEKMKAYVNEKMEELDKRLWEKIDKRFQETEAKILCKLDEIESFVKPQGVLTN